MSSETVGKSYSVNSQRLRASGDRANENLTRVLTACALGAKVILSGTLATFKCSKSSKLRKVWYYRVGTHLWTHLLPIIELIYQSFARLLVLSNEHREQQSHEQLPTISLSSILISFLIVVLLSHGFVRIHASGNAEVLTNYFILALKINLSSFTINLMIQDHDRAKKEKRTPHHYTVTKWQHQDSNPGQVWFHILIISLYISLLSFSILLC